MKELPTPETYEESLTCLPYRDSLRRVIDHVVEHALRGGSLVDVMSGPGYLLGEIGRARGDLSLTGVDIDPRYVAFGRKTYPNAVFRRRDVLFWKPVQKFDVVLCTGAIHHVPYERQERAIANIASLVKPGGFAVISDCYVNEYTNETERKRAAAKLGYEYLKATIDNGASDEVLQWALDILYNDVLMAEYKTSIEKRLPLLRKYFRSISSLKIWPNTEHGHFPPTGYGDYVHVCVN